MDMTTPMDATPVETLRERLADEYDFETDADATCEVCDAENASIDPGESFDDLQLRCDDHKRLRIRHWLFPGDHPTLPSPDNHFTCDECGDEFVFPYGVWAMSGSAYGNHHDYHEYRCLDCASLEWIIHFCTSSNRMEGFERMFPREVGYRLSKTPFPCDCGSVVTQRRDVAGGHAGETFVEFHCAVCGDVTSGVDA